ncbi:MAG: Uma2 family endonuclease [Saprospiraceae bacterium]|nr:Uma2 family endonuclease [Saprospiraceae bacterium]
MASTATGAARKKPQPESVPAYLIKEVIDGIPVYYKGYREVLADLKTPEEIMADGFLQVILKSWMARILLTGLDASKYWIGVGEVGSHISHKNNMAHDLAVYEKSALPASKISNRYADVPAKLVVEIDTEIEYGEDLPVETYVHRKTQNTLDFGTEKVVWIFTASRKVMVAERGQDWIISDWNKTCELLDGIQLNIPEYLKEQGIPLEMQD